MSQIATKRHFLGVLGTIIIVFLIFAGLLTLFFYCLFINFVVTIFVIVGIIGVSIIIKLIYAFWIEVYSILEKENNK